MKNGEPLRSHTLPKFNERSCREAGVERNYGREKEKRATFWAVWWRGSGGEAERAEGGPAAEGGGVQRRGVPGGVVGEGVLGHQE